MTRSWTVAVFDPNWWIPSTGERVVVRDCGHKHRSIRTAEDCRRKLVGYRKGNWSAAWHGATVVETDKAM